MMTDASMMSPTSEGFFAHVFKGSFLLFISQNLVSLFPYVHFISHNLSSFWNLVHGVAMLECGMHELGIFQTSHMRHLPWLVRKRPTPYSWY